MRGARLRVACAGAALRTHTPTCQQGQPQREVHLRPLAAAPALPPPPCRRRRRRPQVRLPPGSVLCPSTAPPAWLPPCLQPRRRRRHTLYFVSRAAPRLGLAAGEARWSRDGADPPAAAGSARWAPHLPPAACPAALQRAPASAQAPRPRCWPPPAGRSGAGARACVGRGGARRRRRGLKRAPGQAGARGARARPQAVQPERAAPELLGALCLRVQPHIQRRLRHKEAGSDAGTRRSMHMQAQNGPGGSSPSPL